MMDISLRAWRENLNVVTVGDHEYFFSYETCIAYRNSQIRFRRNKTYSRTTAKHMTELGVKDWPQVTDAEFESHLKMS